VPGVARRTSSAHRTLDESPLDDRKASFVESKLKIDLQRGRRCSSGLRQYDGNFQGLPGHAIRPRGRQYHCRGKVGAGDLGDEGVGSPCWADARDKPARIPKRLIARGTFVCGGRPGQFLKELEVRRFPTIISVIEPVTKSRDRELVERFRNGDRDAFSALYRAHHAAVFRFALYLTGDRERAGEVTQEVFVWLVHHPSAFDPERGDLPAFLGGVARQMLRRHRREEQRWLPLNETAAGTSPPPEIAESEDAAELWNAIATLPERYREAVILCDLEEMSNEQAASVLGCAVGTIWSRLHRAHELLQRKLQAKKVRCSL
jgi:RNA polymerase sigma-70 factor, ECF subfamily